ncbi:MAG: hypothetical protein HY020_15625 [Burkholderiales bacterium]|nr:hypothetical protein [Burkholderiales bacterium]
MNLLQHFVCLQNIDKVSADGASLITPEPSLGVAIHGVFTVRQRITTVIASARVNPGNPPIPIKSMINRPLSSLRRGAAAQRADGGEQSLAIAQAICRAHSGIFNPTY